MIIGGVGLRCLRGLGLRRHQHHMELPAGFGIGVPIVERTGRVYEPVVFAGRCSEHQGGLVVMTASEIPEEPSTQGA